VAAVSAVPELTVAGMQARVMSVLESIGSATPGIGFALGGLIAAFVSPRAAFLVAGLGVFAIVAIAVPALGRNWSRPVENHRSEELDGSNDIVLELIPGSSPIQKAREVGL
jgi:MFS family permease